MKDSTSLSAPQRGMNRDYNPATLNNTQYSMALNACVENEDDNMMLIQNEPSNLLCSRLEGYKVIGYRIDLDAGCTYFFCVKERASEKGGRKNDSRLICFESTEFIEGVDDVETGSGIDIEKILAEPLETSDSRYEEICASPIKILLTDEYCEDGSSLNFDLCHPIKTIEIKTEKCGKCIYWTDGYNPPRFLNLSKLEPADGSPSWYSYLGEPECGDYSSTTPVCLAVDKLRIFPLRSIPCIDVAGLEYGGHLRAGVYQFCIAICDSFGNEITSYNSLTAPTHIFNEDQRVISGNDTWGKDSNYGIRLKINNLDEYAAYYKVCSIQTTVGPGGEENTVEEYFVLGTFPVSQQTIYYMGDQNLVRTTLAHLAVEKPVYLTAEGMTTSDQKLLMYGLTVENEWNLQPIANLLGSFLYWQTSYANEDLYKDGANVSKYLGYMRDEVYPFGIRFITGDGYKTAIFTLVPPPPKQGDENTPGDEEEVVSIQDGNVTVLDKFKAHEKEIMSIFDNVAMCAEIQRTKYWQFFNTATILGNAEWGQESSSTKECDEYVWGTRNKNITYKYADYNPQGGIDIYLVFKSSVTIDDFVNIDEVAEIVSEELYAQCFGEQEQTQQTGGRSGGRGDRIVIDPDESEYPDELCDILSGEARQSIIHYLPEEYPVPDFGETCKNPTLYDRQVFIKSFDNLDIDYEYKLGIGDYGDLDKSNLVVKSEEPSASYMKSLYVNSDFENCFIYNHGVVDEGQINWFCEKMAGDIKWLNVLSVSPENDEDIVTGWHYLSGTIGENEGCSQAKEVVDYSELTYGFNTNIVHKEANVCAYPISRNETASFYEQRILINISLQKAIRGDDTEYESSNYWLNLNTNRQEHDTGYTASKMVEALRSLLYGSQGVDLSVINENAAPYNAVSYDRRSLAMPGKTGQRGVKLMEDWMSSSLHEWEESGFNWDDYGRVWRSFGLVTGLEAPNLTKAHPINGHFFHQQVNKGAMWFRIDRPDFFDEDIDENEKFIVLDCGGASEDDIYEDEDIAKDPERYRLSESRKRKLTTSLRVNQIASHRVRITFFEDCSGTVKSMPIGRKTGNDLPISETGQKKGAIVKLSDQYVFEIKDSDFYDSNGNRLNTIYLAIEPAIYVGLFQWWNPSSDSDNPSLRSAYGVQGVTFATCRFASNYLVSIRKKELYSITVKAESIEFNAEDKYSASCQICVDGKVGACGTIPNEYGKFGYWESTNNYPQNEMLFDSSKIKISSDMIEDTSLYSKIVEGLSGYEWDGDIVSGAKLCGLPIRHYKFPGNNLVPFMDDMEVGMGNRASIYPIGVVIDDNIVKAFLDIAVYNNVITQSQRSRIVGYEIFRGDRSLHKSIQGTGIGFDVWKYTDKASGEDKAFYYANYPYNDLNPDEYIYKDERRNGFIEHPYEKKGNDKYSFYSPDYLFYPGTDVSEIQLDGYQIGNSVNSFPELMGHEKWILPSEELLRKARRLAWIQRSADNAADVSNIVAASLSGMSAGSVGGWWGALATGLVSLAANLLGNFSRFDLAATYMSSWIDLFVSLGTLRNFAYYHTSYANYNSFHKNEIEGNLLRGIYKIKKTPSGMIYIMDAGETDGVIRYNNRLRETSQFVSLGKSEYKFLYDSLIQDYDTSRIKDGNKTITFKNTTFNSDSISNDDKEQSSQYSYGSDLAPVASPYFKVKNYVPDQYGTIDDIKWISVGLCGSFNEEEPMRSIFGGDIFISRFSVKRQFPFFFATAYEIGDMIPFEYLAYRNVGYPRYYVNFKTEKGIANIKFASKLILDIGENNLVGLPYATSSFELNQQYDDRDGMYLNGKFYTASYGNPMFLVESTINCWYRLTTPNPKDNFYPNVGDYIEWTQERTVPIGTDNNFMRDNSYVVAPHSIGTRKLPSTYDKAFYDCAYQMPNGVAWSKPDLSENDQTDPWLTYKYFDKFEFPSKNGKLIHLKGIEAQQILARFENQVSLYNAIDVLKGRLGENEADLGTGGLFAARPMEYNRTDLGYTGSQSTEMISNEFGHFWVDAKRANIFRVDPNGTGLEEITTGIRLWIREHLPFKIMRYGITVQEGTSGESHQLTYRDIDNKFMGIGISMGWDNKRKTLYVTKKDYIPVQDASNYTFKDCRFYYDGTEVKVSDPEYFKDVSFTIAYNCLKKEWVSYMSYHPDYYVEHLRYFQTGLNWSNDEDEVGLWSHLLTNQSYQVFYGKLYPFIVEVPDKEEYMKKMLSDFRYEMDARRYHNRVEWAQKRLIGFNKAYIYNATNHSGLLNLVPEEKNNMKQKIDYPKTNEDSRDILVTEVDGRWNINDFFNQTTNDLNNVSLWDKDENDIIRDVNLKAITYNKVWNDRLKGDWFLIRLINDKESRFKLVFKWTFNQNKAYL